MADRKVFVDNFIWKFLERCGSQGVSLIVSIVLARLIAPDIFGIMSLIYVFTSVMNVFVDSGLGTALIQKKDADDLDFSSVFYLNTFLGVFLYFVLFVSAPLIASFYNMPELVKILRVVSLTLIISGLRNVQQAYVSKMMIFKKFFYATLSGVLGSAAIALYMAYRGYGIWALVFQNISNLAISTFVLWLVVNWRPKLVFSFQRLGGLVAYGWKLLLTSLLDVLYDNVRALIIGKKYQPADLAYYNMGAQFPYGIVNNINTSIDSVLLPTVSAEQDNKEVVKGMVRRAIVTSSFVMAPIMLCLAAISDSFVYVILTDKWEGCIPFLRVFCIVFLFHPINSSNLNALKALGRSDIVLKLEIAKKVLGIISILITMWISPLAMAYGMMICAFINQFLNAWPNRKLLNYSFFEQLKDLLPNMVLGVLVGSILFLIRFCGFSLLITFIIQILAGLILVPLFSKVAKLESYDYLINVIRMYIRRK